MDQEAHPAEPRLLRLIPCRSGLLVRLLDLEAILRDFDRIEEAGRELVALRGYERIVVDFEDAEVWLPAAFEGKLLQLHKRVAKSGHTLILGNLHPITIRQFEMNKLALLFNIVPDWQDALG